MRRASRLVLILCAATVAAILPAQIASAATPIGEYQLQGTLASSGGVGPALTDIGTGNAFQADTVNGASRQVLSFPAHNGLQMSPAGLGSAGFSVVTTFRLATVAGYNRILDLSNNSSDSGLYANDGKADIYVESDGQDHNSASGVFADNTYATVVFINGDVFAAHSRVFVNGVFATDYSGYLPLMGDTLRFFKDASGGGGTPNEDSAGAVSCIRVFNGQLSLAEVSAIGTSPTCGYSAPASPATPAKHKKKCKKKHKKRAATTAKKCKKKHRR
ncbi:MAG: hypothetical protein QOD14_1733 [Solirubrobacterales bacterium]|jgi:hypothetical protein|nr:hypothetical protein [Solirubrobacterales bacterium]